jgi:hypothetical protein
LACIDRIEFVNSHFLQLSCIRVSQPIVFARNGIVSYQKSGSKTFM